MSVIRGAMKHVQKRKIPSVNPCAAIDAELEVIERMITLAEPAKAIDHSQTINALQKLIK